MARMRDSGIKWIGLIPENWMCKPIRALFEEVSAKNTLGLESKALKFTYGSIVRKTDFDVEDDEYVVNAIRNYTLVRPGTIMLNGLNLNFDFVSQRIGLVREKGAITSAYMAFKAKDDQVIDPEFATYMLKVYDGCKAFHNMGGGVRKILNFSELKRHYFPYPTVECQRKIVDYVNHKCSKIDGLRANIQSEIDTLEEYRQSIIAESVTHGLNEKVALKNSGVAWCPKIPKHWTVANPKGLFSLRTERAFPGDKQLTASQEYGIIFQDEYMELTGNRIVTVLKDFSILKHVEPNDFVISMRSFQGGLEYSEKRGCISSAYVMLIPNEKYVYAPFYRWFFKSSKYINALQSTSNLVRDGQAMRYANFVQIPLFIIPKEEQIAIAHYLDDRVGKIDRVLSVKKDQLKVLEEYKRSIIYEYVTGKREVPNEA